MQHDPAFSERDSNGRTTPTKASSSISISGSKPKSNPSSKSSSPSSSDKSMSPRKKEKKRGLGRSHDNSLINKNRDTIAYGSFKLSSLIKTHGPIGFFF